MKKRVLATLTPVMAGFLSAISLNVNAHGYISKPEARGYLCRLGENTNCGNVIYEPQSLEGRDRYPETGPMDGHIASAGLGVFSPLNAQTVNRWAKRAIKSGANEFTWTFTAAHASRDWRYYITKKDWDPNSPLTRDQFEAVPFCSYEGNYKQPPRQLTHLCNVPADRAGYHVILGVWDVGDTPMSFYNVLDVMVDNGDSTAIEWLDVGDINEIHNLGEGDKVIARVFSATNEITSLQTELLITSDDAGNASTWPKALAEKINQSQSWLQAGIIDQNGSITPSLGRNDIYTQAGSGIKRVELSYVKAPPKPANVTIDGVAKMYHVENDEVIINFSYHTDLAANVEVTLNKSYQTVAKLSQSVKPGYSDFSLIYPNATDGHYNLTVSTQGENGSHTQQGFHIHIHGDDNGEPDVPVAPVEAEYSFPQSLASYKAGTVVFQPKTGKLYECKQWPYNGYCVQYSPGSNQYEPGVGLYWNMAWKEL